MGNHGDSTMLFTYHGIASKISRCFCKQAHVYFMQYERIFANALISAVENCSIVTEISLDFYFRKTANVLCQFQNQMSGSSHLRWKLIVKQNL